MSDYLMPSLVFILLSYCIIWPPSEFISAGFTIEGLFGRYFGNEDEHFILYHIRRILFTLFIYSVLPLGYVTCLYLTGQGDDLELLFKSGGFIWKSFATSALALPILAGFCIKYWADNDFRKHPVVVNLQKYCNNNNREWRSIAGDISIEFRRIDKISITSSALTKVIATENWIIKVCPLTVSIIHQTDASLTVKKAETHLGLQQDAVQLINIEVKSVRPNVESFMIRINVADFKDLEDRVGRSIVILPNVKFHKTVIEQFVDVFVETIKANPRYETDLEFDLCIGCFQDRPNIKLQKLCATEGADGCTTCYCRPMWCVSCLAKWFASRQDSDRKETWLSAKCTCPMCRATFCVLDVCFLSGREDAL